MSSETLSFPAAWAASLEPYLPPPRAAPGQTEPAPSQQQPATTTTTTTTTTTITNPTRPFTTLTYAQSLDSQLALAPGVRTLLSGPESKAMTHFLRARHDAILVGVGTAVADDPGLNCRLAEVAARPPPHHHHHHHHHPRPVVVDPGARWAVSEESKVVQLAREGKGRGPWVLYAEGTDVDEERRRVVEGVDGRYIPVPATRRAAGAAAAATGAAAAETEAQAGGGARRGSLAWESALAVLREEGVQSLMVEGGGTVINHLLELSNDGVDVVDSVIITIAPAWLGYGGVTVAPDRPVDSQGRGVPGPRLGGVRWVQMGEDMVLCGKIAGR